MEGVNASTWKGPVALGAGAISTSSWREGSLRLGRESSYSSGFEFPDGGGDASGGIRKAGGTQRASLPLPLPDSKISGFAFKPTFTLKEK